jgi:hypothetical protein
LSQKHGSYKSGIVLTQSAQRDAKEDFNLRESAVSIKAMFSPLSTQRTLRKSGSRVNSSSCKNGKGDLKQGRRVRREKQNTGEIRPIVD